MPQAVKEVWKVSEGPQLLWHSSVQAGYAGFAGC